MRSHDDRVRGWTWLLAVACCAALTAACATSTGQGGNNNDLIPCEDESDCPTGWTCEGNVCVQPQSDGGVDVETAQGSINVYPDPVQFGHAPLHIDTVREVTIANAGSGDLTVTNIQVIENDQLAGEYIANPFGPMSLVIGPGASEVIQVTLHPEDEELDIAQLEVTSNDPVSEVVTVQLTAQYKGDPTLDVCVLAASPTVPEPFVGCELDQSSQEPLIDYGVVAFGTPVTKVVAIRNAADGNAPLTIVGATVTSSAPAIENDFSVRLFALDTDGVTEIDLSLPLFLSAGDPGQLVEPDVIYAEVTFGANVDGVVSGTRLVITTNDPGGDDVPISAAVSGCPTDYWDINGEQADGCEYHCVYQGAEVCTSGSDDNCNGVQDEEGASGCVNYYHDVDGDQYGVTAEVRCLCFPDYAGDYDTIDPGDCLDSNNSVYPGAQEICDGLDNDCDPSTDETTWTTSCGLGVCDHTINSCVGGQAQTCDPMQGQQTEVCDGLDNDCDGAVDEMTQTDVNNCGSCGNTCTNQHGGTNCISGQCAPTCNSGWADCSDPDDGCETPTNTASDCGGCGIPCNVSNGTGTCSTGTCQVDTCTDGYCDLAGGASDGCEYDLDQNPGCSTYTDLGDLSGDENHEIITWSGFGERWFRVHVRETYEDWSNLRDLSVRIRLNPGAGTDYDLYGYCDNCTGADASSSLGGSSMDEIHMRWEEECLEVFGVCTGAPSGSDSGRYIWINVRYWSANTCASYNLEIYGNPNSGSYTCSEM